MQSIPYRWCRVLILSTTALLFWVAPLGLRAQEADASAVASGTLTGTVVDSSGKSLPNADITIRNETANLVRKVTTGADGRFTMTGLPAGIYTVEVAAPGFATVSREGVQLSNDSGQDLALTLGVANLNQFVNVEGVVSLAAELAPSGNTLDAASAKTEISGAFIKNFTSPVSDFAEIVNLAPGTFSLNPNGIGLGQGKTYFRGFQDGEYTITFDGIPFEDTNSPTHHSWANFPAQWIGGVDFDRSPGQASNFGPTNFGGSINLESPPLQSSQDIRATGTYGSFNTRMLQMDYDSGDFGRNKDNSLLLDIHQLLSDGYQTFNYQKRVAGSGKYQYKISDKTFIKVFAGVVDLWTNTPNTTNPTRAQVGEYGDNYLLSGDPTLSNGTPNPYYYGYNYYHVQTDFEYIQFNTDLGDGWRFDDKAYTTRYWNKQNYQNGATVVLTAGSPSGVNKLNGYRHAGDTAVLSKESKWGVFRAGAWYDWAYTDRYQIPQNILTDVDTPFGNFHEHFITQTFQPFAEYELRATPKLVITAGIKAANYAMALDQYQDVKTVGCLGGTLVKATTNVPATCIGGAAFVNHSIDYNNWLPTLTARYRLVRNWSVYGQAAEGSIIPPSAVFDVTGGNVLTPPKPTLAKTYQTGTVLKFNRWTLDLDAYYVHFQNAYDMYTDPSTNEPIFVATGPSNTKGIEAESNIVLGHGLSLYLNGSLGSAKYQEGPNIPNGGLWVADTPRDVEGVSLLWQQKNWDIGIVNKRVGSMYNDNGTITYLINGLKIPYPADQAISINPFDLTNVFVNYTIKNNSFLRGSKLGFSVNNLANSHNVVGITPFTAAAPGALFVPNPGDQLNLLPGRSFMASLTVGYAPRR